MSDAIIKVENLGKCYRLHHEKQERYTTLRDVIARKAKSLFKTQSSCPKIRTTDEDFWALRDLNFEIKQGEVVGIIGRNGAGKSTLLKILSRITEPTTGRITLRGRVASLLEVGTGFHPELTGRENIFLNGAILGMRKEEIKGKFDEIVAFAEIEKFLDTPVKRYSSGMYVRLAFAVAAHLEPEILVVDEVLAVGDAEFQKKCLGKMKEVSANGRTVLFVSHQLDTIRSLCSRAIQLHQGSIHVEGDVGEVISTYLKTSKSESSFLNEDDPAKSTQILSGEIVEKDESSGLLIINITIKSQSYKKVSLDVRLADALGSTVGFGSFGTLNLEESIALSPGINKFIFSLSTFGLAAGSYLLSLDLTQPYVEYYHRMEQCLSFTLQARVNGRRDRAMLQSWGYGSMELTLKKVI